MYLSLFFRIVIPLAILIGALILRAYNMRKISVMGDEQITRAVVRNIWRGDLRNNWKHAGVSAPFDIDSYNFSSYMYADALFTGRPKRNSWRLDRWFSALTGTASIYVFYLVALRLFGFQVALISLAAMAITPILVQDAHYGRPESFATLLFATIYLLAVPPPNSRIRIGFIGASSFCAGLLIACKVSMIPVALVPLLCLAFRGSITMRSIFIWMGCTVAGAFVGVPDAFFHPHAFWNGVQSLRHQYAGVHVPHALMNASNSLPLWAAYFWQTLGPLFCVLCVAGIVILAKRREYFNLAIIAGPLISYFVFFSLQRTFFERNLSHVVPLSAILASFGAVALCSAIRNRGRIVALFILVLLMVMRPGQVSAKLVFVAMGTTLDERTKDYEKRLMKAQGLPVEVTSELLLPQQVQHLAEAAIGSEHDTLVRILDFHDDFTKKYLLQLKNSLAGREVGYVPSVFPNFSVNTIVVYHAPAFHYIRLSPRSQLQVEGFTFVSWKRVSEPLIPPIIEQGSWAENGLYPDVSVPVARGRFFGSYTSGGDSNRGSIKMGPFDVWGVSQIAIPIVTGPIDIGLSVSIIDHATGLPAIQMNPPPVLRKWAAWQVDLSNLNLRQIDIVAKDDGAYWGQWLGIGFPFKLGAISDTK